MKTTLIQTLLGDLDTPSTTIAPPAGRDDPDQDIASMFVTMQKACSQKLAKIDADIAALVVEDATLNLVTHSECSQKLIHAIEKDRAHAQKEIAKKAKTAARLSSHAVYDKRNGIDRIEQTNPNGFDATVFLFSENKYEVTPQGVGLFLLSIMTDQVIREFAAQAATEAGCEEHGKPAEEKALRKTQICYDLAALKQQRRDVAAKLDGISAAAVATNPDGTPDYPARLSEVQTFNDGQFVVLPARPGSRPVTVTVDGVTQ